MARSERRRQWTFAAEAFTFSHQFLSGLSVNALGHALHFNPLIAHELRKVRADILLVAGSWTSPSALLAAMSRHTGQSIFWSESHLDSIRHADGFANRARRFVLSRFRQFAVPGMKAREYVEEFGSATRIHSLPNVVDPELFRKRSEDMTAEYRHMMGIRADKRVLLIGARLAAEKGIRDFLKSLRLFSAEHTARLVLLIAGDGPQRDDIARDISSASACDIRLLGFQTQSDMAKLYAVAHGFCLPSLSDPNPISVVEALWSGLPLLLSCKVGNHPEALVDGSNGFCFDPLQSESIAEAVSKWLDLTAEQLKNFGDISARIAQTSFDPDCVVARFLDSVLPKA
jgi:glycosyltransferase involved in cell wall biosynthesis